ncbi:hypothetical protein NORO109296_22020 [Nocardiopsis rhodophaea]
MEITRKNEGLNSDIITEPKVALRVGRILNKPRHPRPNKQIPRCIVEALVYSVRPDERTVVADRLAILLRVLINGYPSLRSEPAFNMPYQILKAEKRFLIHANNFISPR